MVVAAGALGTNRLLANCRLRGSLPGISDRLGHLVRTNSESLLAVTMPDERHEAWQDVAISGSVGFAHVLMRMTPEDRDDQVALVGRDEGVVLHVRRVYLGRQFHRFEQIIISLPAGHGESCFFLKRYTDQSVQGGVIDAELQGRGETVPVNAGNIYNPPGCFTVLRSI